jgi:hypothetical protein
VRPRLIDRTNRLLQLLSPPFDKSDQDPGYIKGYPPGIRENGGQYTHAAVWALMAVANTGNGDEATELDRALQGLHRRYRDLQRRHLARLQRQSKFVVGMWTLERRQARERVHLREQQALHRGADLPPG